MYCLFSDKLGQGLEKPKGEVSDLISSIIVKFSNDAIISNQPWISWFLIRQMLMLLLSSILTLSKDTAMAGYGGFEGLSHVVCFNSSHMFRIILLSGLKHTTERIYDFQELLQDLFMNRRKLEPTISFLWAHTFVMSSHISNV